MMVAQAPIEVMVLDWPAGLDGMLLVRDGQATIGLNSRHTPARRHFTFWHEVGHYVLHARYRDVSLPAWAGHPCTQSLSVKA